jgi:hypothetical protein
MRYHLFEAPVLPVVAALKELKSELGSVRQVAIWLNGRIEGKPVYENRIHSLLSGDRRYAINQDTLHRIRRALKLPPLDDSDISLNEWI